MEDIRHRLASREVKRAEQWIQLEEGDQLSSFVKKKTDDNKQTFFFLSKKKDRFSFVGNPFSSLMSDFNEIGMEKRGREKRKKSNVCWKEFDDWKVFNVALKESLKLSTKWGEDG